MQIQPIQPSNGLTNNDVNPLKRKCSENDGNPLKKNRLENNGIVIEAQPKYITLTTLNFFIETINTQKRQIDAQEKHIHELHTKYTQISDDASLLADKADKYETLLEQNLFLTDENDKNSSLIKESNEVVKKTEEKYQELIWQVEDLNKKNHNQKKEIDDKTNLYNTMQANVLSLKTEIKEKDNNFQKLTEEYYNNISQLKLNLDKEREKYNAQEQEVQDLNSLITPLKKQLIQLKTSNEEYNKQLQEANKKLKTAYTATSNKNKALDTKKEYTWLMNSRKNKIAQLKLKVENENLLKQVQNSEKVNEKLTQENGALNSQVDRMKNEIKELKERLNRYQKTNENLGKKNHDMVNSLEGIQGDLHKLMQSWFKGDKNKRGDKV